MALKPSSGVYLSSQQQPKEMWSDTTVVVEALHKRELDRVLGQIGNLRATGKRQNIRLIGRPGIGKSHFLGRVRRRVTEAGDLFVAGHLARADGFWRTLALAYADAFYKPGCRRHPASTATLGPLSHDRPARGCRCAPSSASPSMTIAFARAGRLLG